jgi:hypothetical protein
VQFYVLKLVQSWHGFAAHGPMYICVPGDRVIPFFRPQHDRYLSSCEDGNYITRYCKQGYMAKTTLESDRRSALTGSARKGS